MTTRHAGEPSSGDNRAAAIAEDLEAWLASLPPSRLRGSDLFHLTGAVRRLADIAKGER